MNIVLETLMDRDRRIRREKRNRGLAVVGSYLLVGIFSAATSGVLCYEQGVRKGQAMEMSRPKPAPVVLQPAQLIECSRSGLDELLRLCRAQKRMEKIK